MPSAFKIDLTDEAKATVRATDRLPAETLAGVAKAMDLQNQFTIAHIVRAYLSFPKQNPPVDIGCRAVTGLLRGSIHAGKAVVTGQTVDSSIGSNVEYAAPQEFGATIPAHTIRPKPGNKALRFKIGERVVFAKSVNMPEVILPGRGFIQHGIVDRLGDYADSTSAEILKGWQK